MARVKGAMMTRKRRNKVLKLAKGYWGAKSKQVPVLRLHRPPPEKARLPFPVDHPHLRRLQDERDELLHLHERPEEGRRGDQPQDAGRTGRQRQGRFYRPDRDVQGPAGLNQFHTPPASAGSGGRFFRNPGHTSETGRGIPFACPLRSPVAWPHNIILKIISKVSIDYLSGSVVY